MSWSSEFEPDSGEPVERGRSISFSERERQLYQSTEPTQDLVRNTLKLSVPAEDTQSGPSPLLVIGTIAMAGIALFAGLLFISSAGDDEQTDSPTNTSDPETQPERLGQARSIDQLVGGFDTTQIAFEPGTTSFTPEGFETLSAIRSAIALDPEATLTFDVRTYTEDNPTENHRLSIQQAEIITDFVLEDQMINDAQILARGLGSADIDAGDHLSHFVSISLPGSSRSIQNSIAETSGFAFATDPGQWPTEVPSTSALQSVISLVAQEGVEVEVSINTFDNVSEPSVAELATELSEPGEETQTNSGLSGFVNKSYRFEADGLQLGDSILQVLTNNGVDPSLVSITQRNESVQVPSGVNNVISVVSAEQARLSRSVNEVADLRFLPGTAELDDTGRRALDEVAPLLTDTPETLIINVHTFSQQTAEDNQLLSAAQAEAAAKYLEDQGVPMDRLRPVGSGNSNQFDESGRLTLAVLTIAQ